MKDKRLILSWPILILTGILSLYFYVGNPLDKEFDLRITKKISYGQIK